VTRRADATTVYIFCALTSITCVGLLFAVYRRTRARLLLWNLLCFGWLALNNVLLVLDLAVIKGVDLFDPTRLGRTRRAARAAVRTHLRRAGRPALTFEFLAGGNAVAALAIALFFLRFWRDTCDRLFIMFAIAFAVFAVNNVLLSTLGEHSDARTAAAPARRQGAARAPRSDVGLVEEAPAPVLARLEGWTIACALP
jgi:hypothetical protein